MISKLIKLEREIAGIAGRVRGGMDRSRPRLKRRRTIAAFVKAIKQNLAPVIALSRNCGLAITTSARKLINIVKDYGLAITTSARRWIRIAIHSGSLARTHKRNVPRPLEQPLTTKPTINRPSAVGYFLISACLGLVSICVAMILVLFLQIRDLKTGIAQLGIELAATKARLTQLEKVAQQTIVKQQAIVKEPTPATKTQPAQLPLSFSEADIKVIRQFIKVLPPKPGTLQKIHLGDEIANSAAAPVPESLIDQLPKLRGARFSIDQDGAIIIIGEGSNRVDAVLSYR